MLKVLEPTQGSLGHSGPGATAPGVRGVSESAGAVRSRVSRQAGVSQHVHDERPLEARPTAQASSTSHGSGLAVPLLGKAAFPGTKGRAGPDGTRGRGRRLRLRHALPPVTGAVAREACVRACACVRVRGDWPDPRCPAQPGDAARALSPTRRFSSLPSRADETSSRSDASLTRQRGFASATCLFVIYV